MANTTNFGWETPDDTDLVKDGAAAMRTLGNSIDASFVDLKGGTTGQILSKNSNTDLDYVWINNDQGDITAVTAGTGISGGGTSGAVTITNSMATEITASGDIIVGTGSGTFDNLPIGTTGQVLTADTTVSPYKVKWATASSGLTLIKTASFSNVADTGTTFDDVLSSTYDNYIISVNNFYGATSTADFHFQLRTAGPTTEVLNYQYRSFKITGNSPSTTQTLQGASSVSEFMLCDEIGATNGYGVNGYIELNKRGTNQRIFTNYRFYTESEQTIFGGGYNFGANKTYLGFLLKASTGNIYGTVSVYGLAK